MAWHLALSEDMPGKPYAVVDNTDGSIAGYHPSRESASIQMSTLYVNGRGDEKYPKATTHTPVQPAPEPATPESFIRNDAPVAYSTSKTLAW
jgi:hypothetical protein